MPLSWTYLGSPRYIVPWINRGCFKHPLYCYIKTKIYQKRNDAQSVRFHIYTIALLLDHPSIGLVFRQLNNKETTPCTHQTMSAFFLIQPVHNPITRPQTILLLTISIPDQSIIQNLARQLIIIRIHLSVKLKKPKVQHI